VRVSDNIRIHPTAEVSPRATIGRGTQIWLGVQVREDVRIGEQCVLGKNVYIDAGVQIGDRCKIENNVSVFRGATLEDGVFLGPHCCITNDRLPRAITPDGALKGIDDWEVGPTRLRYGCSIGAGALILPGVTVDRFALVGAGAVVTRSVPEHGLVLGNPARLAGFVCACGGRLSFDGATFEEVLAEVALREGPSSRHGHCARCGLSTLLPLEDVATPAPGNG
jgi:UDP-2-acetamido-3-amino-2,3-dideoxy-glucuronate N-acetyltransferase